jgi:hypothetical protein
LITIPPAVTRSPAGEIDGVTLSFRAMNSCAGVVVADALSTASSRKRRPVWPNRPFRSLQITTSEPGVLPIATAAWVPSHRAPELMKPLSSTDGLALGSETGSWVTHFTTAPTETASPARRAADPLTDRRLPERNRRGGGLSMSPAGSGRSRQVPRARDKVDPVMQLRALVARYISARHDAHDKPWLFIAIQARISLIHWGIC